MATRAQKRTYFHPVKGYVHVKQGFSWPAFFFGSFWALVKRMWFPAFALMTVFEILLWFVSGYAQAQRNVGLALLGAASSLIYCFLRGRYGNRLLARVLLNRGFTECPEVAPPV